MEKTRSWWQRAVACASVLALLGCSTGPSVYYRAERTYQLRRAPASPTPAKPEAVAVLRSARTLAVLPPAPCAEKPAGARDVSTRSARLGLACGQVAGELETQALQRGYRVVSWRALAGAADPMQAAAQSGVDVVLRVSEAPAAIVPASELKERDRRYVEELVAPNVPVEPLKVKPERIAAACDARFRALLAKSQPATALRVAAVDAKGGGELWSIGRLVLDAEGADGRIEAEHQTRTWTTDWATDAIGPVVMLVGTVFLLAPVYMPLFGETGSQEAETTIQVFAITGGVLVASSLVMLLAGPRGIRTHHDRAANTCRTDEARFRLPPPSDTRRARRVAQELGERTFSELEVALGAGGGG